MASNLFCKYVFFLLSIINCSIYSYSSHLIDSKNHFFLNKIENRKTVNFNRNINFILKETLFSENRIISGFNRFQANNFRTFDSKFNDEFFFGYELNKKDSLSVYLFSGQYSYEFRKKQNFINEYQVYDFSPFYFIDTNSASIKFESYAVKLGYGRIFEKINIFFLVDYTVRDGIKNGYSFSLNSIRDLTFYSKFMYEFKLFNFNLFFSFNDYLENINTKERNLLSVENKLYRGNKYYLLFRGDRNYYKSKISEFNLGFNAVMPMSSIVEHQVGFETKLKKNISLIPNSNFLEFEDGRCQQLDNYLEYLNVLKLLNNFYLTSSFLYNFNDTWASFRQFNNKQIEILRYNIKERRYGISIFINNLPSFDYLKLSNFYSEFELDTTYFINSAIANFIFPKFAFEFEISKTIQKNFHILILLNYNRQKYSSYFGQPFKSEFTINLGTTIVLNNKNSFEIFFIQSYFKVTEKKIITKYNFTICYNY